jgi:hypothetical protein
MPPTPPPGDVFERAERTVQQVKQATGITLDYTPETLPILDHYLGQVPRGRTEILALVVETIGSYFGEVVRKALGGTWEHDGRLELDGGIVFSPEAMVAEAAQAGPVEDVDAEFTVPLEARGAVEDALSRAGGVDEAEYYSLSGRFETLLLVAHTVSGAKAQSSSQSEMSPTRTTPDTDDISSPAGSESPEE